MKVHIKPGGYAILFVLTAAIAVLVDRGVMVALANLNSSPAASITSNQTP